MRAFVWLWLLKRLTDVLSLYPPNAQDADLTEAIVDYQMTLLQQVKGVSERVREVAQEKPHKASRRGKNGERNPFTCVVQSSMGLARG